MSDVGVSVVMPVYNAATFLKDSIEDILNQTYDNFEIICVDDGSTDDSGRILDAYSLRDDRLRVIHQTNKGGGIARDEGLRCATGKYVLFLDADDRFDKGLLTTVFSDAENNDCDILAFNADVFDNATSEVKSAPWLILKDEQEINGNPFDVLNTTIWNKLFLRSFLIEYDIHFVDNMYCDTMFFVSMTLLHSRKTVIRNEILLHYRINNMTSLISNQDKDYMAVCKNLEFIRGALDADDKKMRIYYTRLAERVLVDRLRMMKTKESYCGLYNYIHNEAVRKLGLNFHLISNTKEGIRLKNIINKDIEEDLFEYKKNLIESGIISSEVFGLPDIYTEEHRECRVVLYGAGIVGKDYFRQIQGRRDIKLIAWADRMYENIGFPICSPEKIVDLNYDYILIAISDEKIVARIINDLKQLGVEQSKIIWKTPRVIAT